ncbi:hypothetical protein KBB96_10910 [Luteolibacter ambystomatis]|uniref:Uncharacterized protein n=1 Tax=Luteolibacter ambystomatis TaxID=2824561 RepID=A0A975IXJ2_9BACT|nr:hypothetical protein [Luteolibacter ambystomatis]QUE49381.1 hypothetical protein KBB96_10910 [Luteolibacter ambystomatis]
MSSIRRLSRAVLVVAIGIFACASARADSPPAEKPLPVKTDRLPGVDLSQGITEVTGVAISPLLGVSGVGAWRYFHTDAALRDKLPWFCHPAAWGCGFAVLLLCFAKDTFGTAVPGVLKKPLDMVELFENKASALVASTAFVPFVAREMADHFQATGEGTTALLLPLASITGVSVVAVSTVVVVTIASVVSFLAVWLTGHAINVLIILSPFSLVDAFLKLCRTAVMSLIVLSYFIAPWLAAGLCVAIILLALWLAPATLRLSSFGTRYATDVLLPWFGRRRATHDRPHAFTLGRFGGLPVRTAGRLAVSEDGTLAFHHRPWGVMTERSVPLPDGEAILAKGLLSPALLVRTSENQDGAKFLLLLPRYRGREEEISTHFKIREVRDHALARGFAAMKAWWKEQVRRRRGSVVEAS